MNSNCNYSPETPNSGQNRRLLLSRVTLQLDGWPSKPIGPLFYIPSSFVHHFIAISELKLELQSGNAQFGSKSMFLSLATLEFNRWPWRTIDRQTDKQKEVFLELLGRCIKTEYKSEYFQMVYHADSELSLCHSSKSKRTLLIPWLALNWIRLCPQGTGLPTDVHVIIHAI